MRRQFKDEELSHAKINFSYLDLYEEKVDGERKQYNKMKSEYSIEEAESEQKKPAFFQRDATLEAGKEEKEKLESGDIEPWRLEEWEAFKKLEKELDVDFKDKDLDKHEKVMEFFKLSKDKQVVDDMNEKVFETL